MAKLHLQMMTVKIAPCDEEIYLSKDSNDWKAEPISHSGESVHIMKMTVLYPFVVFISVFEREMYSVKPLVGYQSRRRK